MELIRIVFQWVIPTVLTALSGYIVSSLKENKKSNQAMKDSMRIILRSQIVSKVEKYEELGYLPDYARSCIEDLYVEYKNLKGNHGVDQLVQQAFSLPPIEKGE